jgi:hypothetical protein
VLAFLLFFLPRIQDIIKDDIHCLIVYARKFWKGETAHCLMVTEIFTEAVPPKITMRRDERRT